MDLDKPYRHYHFVIDLGRVHAQTLEEAQDIAYEHMQDLTDMMSYKPWDDILKLQGTGPCSPDDGRVGGCEEYEEYEGDRLS